ncbi:hypothetical protein O6H91_01G075200 [Diphasiastrum complanatum]|uniref:Uncharacterized protein n=1 Tax=Diphasiastrum complanatum TaxID=34168 RepID=A0ACC2ES74_DIPCM|nr:hypothetical protein O6H91_01G075200 [Diphasiastrum complanatum]
MFATLVRLLASKPKHNTSKYPKAWFGGGEAQGSCNKILSILKTQGPLKVSDCWTHAEQAGIKSKRHMKILLRWMKEQQRVRVLCNHLSEDKTDRHNREFMYSAVLPKAAVRTEEQIPQ